MSTEPAAPQERSSKSMIVREVDPYEVNVSEMNERRTIAGLGNPGIDDIVDSIDRTGIIQPPLVRERDGEDLPVPYEVVVGQRRVMAAQAVDLDSIPVVVVDWNDPESLAASITENVDTFRESVSDSDRVRAVKRLEEMTDWTREELASQLGVSVATIRTWFERANETWKGTWLDPDPESNDGRAVLEPNPDHEPSDEPQTEAERYYLGERGPLGEDEEEDENEANVEPEPPHPTTKQRLDREPHPDDLGDKQLQVLRPALTQNGYDTTDDLDRITKHLAREALSLHETEEVAQRIKRGQKPIEAIDEVSEAKSRTHHSQIKVSTRVVFEGDAAEALQRAAEDRGTSDEGIVRDAIEEWLSDRGYLQ